MFKRILNYFKSFNKAYDSKDCRFSMPTDELEAIARITCTYGLDIDQIDRLLYFIDSKADDVDRHLMLDIISSLNIYKFTQQNARRYAECRQRSIDNQVFWQDGYDMRKVTLANDEIVVFYVPVIFP